MYQYIVYYDYLDNDGFWKYNNEFKISFKKKGFHASASWYCEQDLIGLYDKYKITKVTCD